MTERKLLDSAKAHVIAELAELEGPDDDIMPHFLWLGRYGIGFMPLQMPDDAAKDQIAEAMVASLIVGRATEAVFVSTAWVAAYRRDDPTVNARAGTAEVRPSEHPDREEIIMLMYHTRREALLISAPVTRHPDKPPTLGDWETHEQSHPKFRQPGGRFGDAIRMGLHGSAEMPPEMAELIDEGWALGEQQDMIDRFIKVHHSMTRPGTAPPTVELEPIVDDPPPGQVIEGLFGTRREERN